MGSTLKLQTKFTEQWKKAFGHNMNTKMMDCPAV